MKDPRARGCLVVLGGFAVAVLVIYTTRGLGLFVLVIAAYVHWLDARSDPRATPYGVQTDVAELHAWYLRQWVILGFRTEGPEDTLVRVRAGDLVRRSRWLAAAAVGGLVTGELTGISPLAVVVGLAILALVSYRTVPAVPSGGYEASGSLLTPGEPDGRVPIGSWKASLDALGSELATQIEAALLGLADSLPPDAVGAFGVGESIRRAMDEAEGRWPVLVEHAVQHEGNTLALARFVVDRD